MPRKDISIVHSKECVGCNSCVQVCPKHCITQAMLSDGFLHPLVDENICVECGKCQQVCPILHPNEPKIPYACYAAYNKDDALRKFASSGALFVEFAKYVLSKDGVVFGAVFDSHWNVIHVSAKRMEDIYPMMGSKYVQSNILQTFVECKEILMQKKKVLFTGTPCQIAALHRFLKKDNTDNLFTMDVVCHGVPSPAIWQRYLKETFGKNAAFMAADGKNTVLLSWGSPPLRRTKIPFCCPIYILIIHI